MLGHYQVLLEGIVANPEARIAELPLLTRLSAISCWWNGTGPRWITRGTNASTNFLKPSRAHAGCDSIDI